MMGVLGWDNTKRAAALRKDGLTNRQIAKRLGVNEDSVYGSLGASPHTNRRRHSPSLLAKAERLRWEGWSLREIERELGVPRSTLSGRLGREAA